MDQKCRFEYKTNITATHVSKASWKPSPELRATKVPSGACRQRRRATLGLLVLNPWIGFWNSYFIWVAVGWAEFFFTTFCSKHSAGRRFGVNPTSRNSKNRSKKSIKNQDKNGKIFGLGLAQKPSAGRRFGVNPKA